jgi:hypothetical protein
MILFLRINSVNVLIAGGIGPGSGGLYFLPKIACLLPRRTFLKQRGSGMKLVMLFSIGNFPLYHGWMNSLYIQYCVVDQEFHRDYSQPVNTGRNCKG